MNREEIVEKANKEKMRIANSAAQDRMNINEWKAALSKVPKEYKDRLPFTENDLDFDKLFPNLVKAENMEDFDPIAAKAEIQSYKEKFYDVAQVLFKEITEELNI